VIAVCKCGAKFEKINSLHKWCKACRKQNDLKAKHAWNKKTYKERNFIMSPGDLRMCKFVSYEKKEMSVDEEVWRDCLLGRMLEIGHIRRAIKDNGGTEDDCFPEGMILEMEGERYVIRGKTIQPLTSA